jgi:hypothetical protein
VHQNDIELNLLDKQVTRSLVIPVTTMLQQPSQFPDPRVATLAQTLQDLNSQRQNLLLELHSKLSNQAASASSSTTDAAKRQYYPSVHAHSQPVPPLTPSNEALLLAQAQHKVREHIRSLTRYNELRDVGMGLIGIVAENRGLRMRDCLEEFGVAEGD